MKRVGVEKAVRARWRPASPLVFGLEATKPRSSIRDEVRDCKQVLEFLWKSRLWGERGRKKTVKAGNPSLHRLVRLEQSPQAESSI